VGAFTAGLLAALVALVSDGAVTALIVVGVIVAIQQIEGDVIYPVLVGRQIRLHPVAILLVLTAGAVVAGIVGALFAVPVAAVGWTAIQHLRGERRPKDITPPPGEG
jgi:predicted PurR-regulated permease PerM